MSINDESLYKYNNMLIPLYKHTAEMLCKDLKGGINLTQLLIMKYIAIGVSNTKDISDNLNLTPAAISKMVDQLCEKGYLERERSLADRRLITLINSEQGKEVLKCNNDVHKEALRRFIDYLDDSEITAFEVTIKALCRYLEIKGIKHI